MGSGLEGLTGTGAELALLWAKLTYSTLRKMMEAGVVAAMDQAEIGEVEKKRKERNERDPVTVVFDLNGTMREVSRWLRERKERSELVGDYLKYIEQSHEDMRELLNDKKFPLGDRRLREFHWLAMDLQGAYEKENIGNTKNLRFIEVRVKLWAHRWEAIAAVERALTEIETKVAAKLSSGGDPKANIKLIFDEIKTLRESLKSDKEGLGKLAVDIAKSLKDQKIDIDIVTLKLEMSRALSLKERYWEGLFEKKKR